MKLIEGIMKGRSDHVWRTIAFISLAALLIYISRQFIPILACPIPDYVLTEEQLRLIRSTDEKMRVDRPNCAEFWINRYQSLIGALASIGAAIYAGYWVSKQVRRSDEQIDLTRAQLSGDFIETLNNKIATIDAFRIYFISIIKESHGIRKKVLDNIAKLVEIQGAPEEVYLDFYRRGIISDARGKAGANYQAATKLLNYYVHDIERPNLDSISKDFRFGYEVAGKDTYLCIRDLVLLCQDIHDFMQSMSPETIGTAVSKQQVATFKERLEKSELTSARSFVALIINHKNKIVDLREHAHSRVEKFIFGK